jgi:hypothetical protein
MAEEGFEKARPGIGGDQNALAARKSRADQLARDDMRAIAHLAPRQGRELLALGIIKGHPGLALGRIVEHRGHRGETGAVQGELRIASGQRFHRKARLLAEGMPPLKTAPTVHSTARGDYGALKLTHPDPQKIVADPRQNPVFPARNHRFLRGFLVLTEDLL